ncbi:diphthine methyltransferase [Calliphora vicina]|uniref:diphthine methyltransferase n=1 Tax=Calliphora vicina TaxID=7373 RepID=UPI00325C1CE0
MLKIQTLHSIDTEYSADSIEWCPHPDYNNYFVCGTYQLEENQEGSSTATPPCRRKGRIYLYKFDRITKSLNELDRLETAAILDMKWLKGSGNELPLLATANALGQIDVYALENVKLKHLHSLDLSTEHDNLLALSLDWGQIADNLTPENSTNHILVSDSKGGISLLSWTNERSLTKVRTWPAHNFEAWICAFDKWDKNRVYTGGDDTFLHGYDLRMESRVLLNKSHMAGVTCLLSHPKREHILLTGSYDENLRIFDTRSMKQPMSEINLSGGIWRLKSHPLQQNTILAACMYHNFSVVDLHELVSPKLVGEYFEHKSICYGADWCLNSDENEEALYMATCSFYDHKLCVASVEKI